MVYHSILTSSTPYTHWLSLVHICRELVKISWYTIPGSVLLLNYIIPVYWWCKSSYLIGRDVTRDRGILVIYHSDIPQSKKMSFLKCFLRNLNLLVKIVWYTIPGVFYCYYIIPVYWNFARNTFKKTFSLTVVYHCGISPIYHGHVTSLDQSDSLIYTINVLI